jgi:RHS repeat-associated protein
MGEQIAGANYYFTTDHLGSIREMTDSSGAVRARYEYDPYGRLTKVSGDLESDFGFTGFYRHQASGLNLTLFRAYDADLGRWVNRDPIAEMGGLNLYAYCMNDPLNSYDPLGLWSWGGFGRGIVNGLAGIAVGIGLTVAVVAGVAAVSSVAIASAVAVGLVWGGAIIGSAVLGWKIGEAITGEDGFGRGTLCDERRSELVGEALVGLIGMAAPRAAAETSIANRGTPLGKWLSQGQYWRVGASGAKQLPTLRIGAARPPSQWNHINLNYWGY